MNKNKLNKNNKNELINYIPSPRPKSYAAAVVNNSNSKLYKLTSPLGKTKLHGHPDTAATGIFLAQKHSNIGTKIQHEQFGVLCANNTTMNSTTTRQLNLSPDLPAIIQQGHTFNKMDKSLVLVPVLCDAGCQVLFGEHKVQVIKNNKVIIEGDRDAVTNLWLIPLENDNTQDTKPTTRSAYIQLQYTSNSAYCQKSAAHLQAFHHASLGAPVVTTLIRAINKNWLTSFPGLTANGIRKHLPKST